MACFGSPNFPTPSFGRDDDDKDLAISTTTSDSESDPGPAAASASSSSRPGRHEVEAAYLYSDRDNNGTAMKTVPPNRTASASCSQESCRIQGLLHRLMASNHEDQRSAAGEIRLLTKLKAENRLAIAEAGAIPLLVRLLSAPDSRTQEHAVTALLNLSICNDDTRETIVSSGAVPSIVTLLKTTGSMEARENAAATLFSLSAMDEYKVSIGKCSFASGAPVWMKRRRRRSTTFAKGAGAWCDGTTSSGFDVPTWD